MTGGTKPVGKTLPPANTKFPAQAKKKLTATFTNSKIASSHSKHRASHFSNRNKNAHCRFQPLHIPVHPVWGRSVRLFTLPVPSPPVGSGAEGRGESAGIRASRLTNHRPSNRNSGEIEIVLTHSKQTTETISNRNCLRGSRMGNQESFLTSHESRILGSDHGPGSPCAVYASRSKSRDAVSTRYRDTTRGTFCAIFFRGAKQNWRNSNHA